MPDSRLFSEYLHNQMQKQQFTAERLQKGLGYRTSIAVSSWLAGRSRPPLQQLPGIALVLKADPVEVVVGWVIDQLPEVETVLRREVLEPRGSTFPR